jgi:hypothetical protein
MDRTGYREELETACVNMRKLFNAGVRVLPGGDYGFPYNPIGTNARDLQWFVELLGYTPTAGVAATAVVAALADGRLVDDVDLTHVRPPRAGAAELDERLDGVGIALEDRLHLAAREVPRISGHAA